MLKTPSKALRNTTLPYDTDLFVRHKGYVFQAHVDGERSLWERWERDGDLAHSFMLVAPKTIRDTITEANIVNILAHVQRTSKNDLTDLVAQILTKAPYQGLENDEDARKKAELEYAIKIAEALQFGYHYPFPGQSHDINLTSNADLVTKALEGNTIPIEEASKRKTTTSPRVIVRTTAAIPLPSGL